MVASVHDGSSPRPAAVKGCFRSGRDASLKESNLLLLSRPTPDSPGRVERLLDPTIRSRAL
ncbi:hypothetical protein PtA15_10A667 [Puccinia triticina]|uniref:Uncharacterized protein n=1 Tax=Puccinia triticina TaxID=208348 RepID=A0ABY7CVC0_9BASI|nr:uncharacterized protein PtA15_10A667 [Puccinia triticina]WAQ89243.1 hypothetical protein PtA15_10A667 [Puccinia triticina]WAR59295.1 hypothetical protein PtB15_10B637 [Puccinia triticina]